MATEPEHTKLVSEPAAVVPAAVLGPVPAAEELESVQELSAATAEELESAQGLAGVTDEDTNSRRRRRAVTLGACGALALVLIVTLSIIALAPAQMIIEDSEVPLAELGLSGTLSISTSKPSSGTASLGAASSGAAQLGSSGTSGSAASQDGANGASSNGGAGTAAGGTNSGKVWHEAWDEQVWVDTSHYVHHDEIWGQEPIWGERCNDCGYAIASSIIPHLQETGHGRYSTDVVIGHTPYIAVPAKDEWVQDGHYETRHHEGYWS